MLNHLSGKMAEHLLTNEFRSRKQFSLFAFFTGVKDDTELNIIDFRERIAFQRENDKQIEIDVKAESSCGRVILVEVKKTQMKTGLKMVEDFHEKTATYAKSFPDQKILPAFLSLGGFTDEEKQFCEEKGIATAEKIMFFQIEENANYNKGD